MNLEQINQIISNYNDLVVLAKSKIEVIKKLDRKYNTARGIEEIYFEDDFVFVQCDDSCMGCYDSLTFSFPIAWLSKTDTELEDLIITEKELKEEILKKEKQQKLLEEKKKSEQQEFEQYQRLKAKYEL